MYWTVPEVFRRLPRVEVFRRLPRVALDLLGSDDLPKLRRASVESREHEASAALAAYERNAYVLADSPYPKPAWVFGSGGAYGLIPANALAPFFDTLALRRGEVGPYDVFDPKR